MRAKLQLHYHHCRTQSESGGHGDRSACDRDVERLNNVVGTFNKKAQSIDKTIIFTGQVNAVKHVNRVWRKLNHQVSGRGPLAAVSHSPMAAV